VCSQQRQKQQGRDVSSEEDVSPTCSESASARDAAQGSDHLDAEGAQSHWESSDTGDAKMSKSRRKKLRRKDVRAERLVQQAIMFCLLHSPFDERRANLPFHDNLFLGHRECFLVAI
jgi:hypothetical protein